MKIERLEGTVQRLKDDLDIKEYEIKQVQNELVSLECENDNKLE